MTEETKDILAAIKAFREAVKKDMDALAEQLSAVMDKLNIMDSR